MLGVGVPLGDGVVEAVGESDADGVMVGPRATMVTLTTAVGEGTGAGTGVGEAHEAITSSSKNRYIETLEFPMCRRNYIQYVMADKASRQRVESSISDSLPPAPVCTQTIFIDLHRSQC